MQLRRNLGILAASGLTFAIVAAAPANQPDRKGPPPRREAPKEVAPDRVTVLSIEKTDLDRYLVDKKDANLKAAIRMIPARLGDLYGELGLAKQGVPAELFAILPDLCGRPARLAVQFRPDAEGGTPGVGLVAAVDTVDRAAAERLAKKINSALKESPVGEMMNESADAKGMMEVETPAGIVRWGPAQTGDQWSFVLTLGKLAKPDAAFAATAPASAVDGKKINPFFLRGRLDLAPLTPLVQMVKAFTDGEQMPGAIFDGLEKSGLIGPDSVRYEFNAFHTEDRAVMTTRAVGAKRFPDAGYVFEPLTAAQLRVIPADAHFGSIGRVNLPMIVGNLKQSFAAIEPVAEAVDAIKQQVGIDIWADVVEQFTGTFAVYTSDATGGGGLGSLIVAVELKDGAKGVDVSRKLEAAANKFLADEARRMAEREPGIRPMPSYFRYRTYTSGTTHMGTISFPGLPIPLEPTYAVADRWLLVALTPQAATAAAAQATGKGDAGILSHPEVASTIPKGTGLNSLSVIDVRKNLPRGYTFLSLAGSGLANGVRTNPDFAKGGAREPAMIVPTFAELMNGARSQISFSRWEGEDLVSEWQGDRSLLVNVGSTVGAASTFAPVLIGIAAAATMATSRSQMAPVQARPRPNFSIVAPQAPAPPVAPAPVENAQPAPGR